MAVDSLRQRHTADKASLDLAGPLDKRPLLDDAALQEMEELRDACLAPFDGDDAHHLAMLETLWRSALPDKPFERRSEKVRNSAQPCLLFGAIL